LSHTVCVCYYNSCAATILSDVNCTTMWNGSSNTFAYEDTRHDSASTLEECQKACEFDPRCVAVDWNSHVPDNCDLNTDTNHDHHNHSETGDATSPSRWDHYDLVSRCNIIPGQCSDSHVIANKNIQC